MCLKLPLGLILICMCCPSGVVDMEAKIPCEAYTYVVESCIRWHHVSKDFCTPVINEVCSDSKGGKFGGRTRVQKKFQLLLTIFTDWLITATVRDSCQYSNDLLQDELKDCLLHFFVYGHSLAEACAVITNSTLMQRNFWYIISL